ncbi:MAG: V-type ATP synthase subunit F [Firmicutes bacterium]|nr:V-type ATP synthase subunit F [Bacillota bacterium]
MEATGKIAAIGDKDTMLAFKALGMDVFYATKCDEIRETIAQLERDDYKVIFITDTEAGAADEYLRTFDAKPYPIILSIPDGRSKENYSITKIVKNMERAVGSSTALK